MKKLIFRKIILDVLAFFLVSSFALTLIVWVIQAVNYLDFVSEDGHSFRVYFMFSILTIPKIFSKISIFCSFHILRTSLGCGNHSKMVSAPKRGTHDAKRKKKNRDFTFLY